MPCRRQSVPCRRQWSFPWSFRVIETMYIEAKHHVHLFGGARRPACREIVIHISNVGDCWTELNLRDCRLCALCFVVLVMTRGGERVNILRTARTVEGLEARTRSSRVSNSFENLTFAVWAVRQILYLRGLCVHGGLGEVPFEFLFSVSLFSAVRSTCAHRRRSGGQSRTPVPVKAYCTTPFTTSPDSCTSRMQWYAHVRTRARARLYDYAHRIVGSGGEVEDPDV